MTARIRIDLLSLFPGMAEGFLAESILGRAQSRGIVDIHLHNLRDWAEDKHSVTDDRPFGGGAGMVLKPGPVFAAVESLHTTESKVIYLSPDGKKLGQPLVRELAEETHLILISGHYEGLDQRVRDELVDEEISIGDYVLTNGTLPALVLIDAVCRYIPEVLGEGKSLTQDAFNNNLLGFPQYTRPAKFRSMHVPEILLSGDHAAIAQWRHQKQIDKTRERRPDMAQTT